MLNRSHFEDTLPNAGHFQLSLTPPAIICSSAATISPTSFIPEGFPCSEATASRGETYLACIARELHEEITYLVAAERFGFLTTLDGCGEVVGGDIVRGHVFLVTGIPADEIVVTEGSLAIIDPDDLMQYLSQLEGDLTPASRFGLRGLKKMH